MSPLSKSSPVHVRARAAASKFGTLRSAYRNVRLASALTALTLVGSTVLIGCGGGNSSLAAPGNTGTTGTTGTTPAAGRGVVNATFSNVAGTNANTAAFQSTMAQALTNSNAAGLTLFNVTGTSISGSTSRTFAYQSRRKRSYPSREDVYSFPIRASIAPARSLILRLD